MTEESNQERVQHKRVAANSVYLFVLTFSNYFLYLITIPYQTRVLGPEVFGVVGFAIAFTSYFKIAVDFGFMISATEQVSRNRDDKEKVSSILSNTIYAKIGLTAVSMLVLLLLCLFVPMFRNHVLLFVLFFISVVAKSFIPDFVYRGIERMRSITVRTVVVQVFFMLLLFIFVKSPDDVLWIPALEATGSIVALIIATKHIHHLGYRIVKTSVAETLKTLREGLWFFYSRLAANIYTATNIFVLGLVYGAASQIVGLFTSADRLVSAGKQLVTPVGDALYPHMISKKDFGLMKRAIMGGMIIMAIGCGVVAVFANDICSIIFGSEYYAAGDYLRILTIAVFFAFPGVLLGFPTLSPMGLAKQANVSNILAAVFHITQILILLVVGQLTVINICIATCVTEFIALLYRAYVVIKHRDRLKVDTVETVKVN